MQFLEHVLRGFNELRSIADQPMSALGEGGVDGPGNREHFAPLLCREARGDERAAVQCGFDYEHTSGEAADHAVSPGKVLRQRRGTERKLGGDTALALEALLERTVRRRVIVIDPGADDCKAASSGGESAPMRRGVDAG